MNVDSVRLVNTAANLGTMFLMFVMLVLMVVLFMRSSNENARLKRVMSDATRRANRASEDSRHANEDRDR